jgi:UDP-GlcNAc:undecaprenyl-phosphate GlcNAc-1-phosphate transferase
MTVTAAANVLAAFPGLLAQLPSRECTADEVLSPYVPVFYAAFLVAFVFTPIMRYVAMHHRVIDEPDHQRKMHKFPVAYLGGVALFLGWLAGLAVSQFLHLHRMEPGWPTSIPVVKFSVVMGGLVIVVLGLWDDMLGVSPRIKIAGQITAAALLLWDGVGVTCARPLLAPLGAKLLQFTPLVHLVYGDGVPPEFFFPEWFIIAVSSVIVVAVVVGCCNASNLMDGLDGLCGGVTAIIAAGLLFVAVHLAQVGGGINTNVDAMRVILGLALLGAVLGFIPYNFNPASIFMGDTGSMLLGFSCATMILLMAQEQSKWFLAAMVVFALPILDTALAFARRWINGRPLFSADKQHFHHQLVARGFSVKQTVLVSYGLALVFAFLGAAMVFLRTRYAVAFYLIIFGWLIVAAYKMGMVHERPRHVRRQQQLSDALANSHAAAPAPGGAAVLEVGPVTTSAADTTGDLSGHPDPAAA